MYAYHISWLDILQKNPTLLIFMSNHKDNKAYIKRQINHPEEIQSCILLVSDQLLLNIR